MYCILYSKSGGDQRINRPGGTGRVTKIHYSVVDDRQAPVVVGLDVKYTVTSGHDRNVSPMLVEPHVELEVRGRRPSRNTPVPSKENEEPNQSKQHAPQLSKNKPKVPPIKKKLSPINVSISATKGSRKETNSALRTNRSGGARKVLRSLFKAPVTFAHPASPPAQTVRDIPLEISVDTPNTPESGVSDGTPNAQGSPLRQRDIRQPPQSHVCIINPACEGFATADDDPMDCDGKNDAFHVLQLHISPSNAAAAVMRKENDGIQRVSSGLSSTPLATGVYSMQGMTFSSTKVESAMNCAMAVEPQNDEQPNGNVPLNVSLRDVFDNGLKKAGLFIDDMVTGVLQQPKPARVSEINADSSVDNERRSAFQQILMGLFWSSDMIEVATLAEKMTEFAASNNDTDGVVFDYSETEVSTYLKELCELDFVMRTDEWLVKI